MKFQMTKKTFTENSEDQYSILYHKHYKPRNLTPKHLSLKASWQYIMFWMLQKDDDKNRKEVFSVD